MRKKNRSFLLMCKPTPPIAQTTIPGRVEVPPVGTGPRSTVPTRVGISEPKYEVACTRRFWVGDETARIKSVSLRARGVSRTDYAMPNGSSGQSLGFSLPVPETPTSATPHQQRRDGNTRPRSSNPDRVIHSRPAISPVPLAPKRVIAVAGSQRQMI